MLPASMRHSSADHVDSAGLASSRLCYLELGGCLAASCASAIGASELEFIFSSTLPPGQESTVKGGTAAWLNPPAPEFATAANGEPQFCWRECDGFAWFLVEMTAKASRLGLSALFLNGPSKVEGKDLARCSEPWLLAYGNLVELQMSTDHQTDRYRAALNCSATPTILLDANGLVEFANAAAEVILDSGEYIRKRGLTLSCISISDSVKLRVAIDHACEGGVEGGDVPIIIIERARPLRPLVIAISPIRGNSVSGGSVLSIVSPSHEPLALSPICQYYSLTRVETGLACALAHGESIRSAATMLRITQQTARSYLKQIFLKTSTNRQADLLRLLLTSAVRSRQTGTFRVV